MVLFKRLFKLSHIRCGQGLGAWPPSPLQGESRLVRQFWRVIWQYLRKLLACVPFDPAVLLLGIYSKYTLMSVDNDVHTVYHDKELEAT